MRLDRYLSNMGVCTRSEAGRLIRAGRVKLDGRTALNKEEKVLEGVTRVEFDGAEVPYRPFVYIMLNKPAGYISSNDEGGGPVVTDLLSEELSRYSPSCAGRLDRDAEGLMLLTNDGDYIHRVITPGKHVKKTYFVTLRSECTPEDVKAFAEGIVLGDGTELRPGKLEPAEDTEDGAPAAYVTIQEGKFHQVKRMFSAVGNSVLSLKRLSIGGIRLDPGLSPGGYRELPPEEAFRVFDDPEAAPAAESGPAEATE